VQGQSEKASWFKSLKFDMELGAIALVYFVQGALGLSHLAVSFFLKDRLSLSPAEVASLVGIAMVPWTIKPLYGMISDSFPIAGYRRRPYLVLSSLLGSIAWLCMAMTVKTPLAATIAIGLASLSVACSDAITDALVVQRARLESEGDAGSLQSFSWAAVSIGAISSAYFSGFILERWGTQVVFEITAALPILVAIAAFAISDRAVKAEKTADLNNHVATGIINPAIKHQLQQLRQAVTSKQIWLPAAFIFLWQATPSADTAFFFFSTNELGFNPEFLGTVRLATSLAGLLGVWIFQRYLKAVPMRRIFLWSTLISTILGLTSLVLITHANRSLGIDDRWFSMGDSLILTVAGRIAYMPVLVLAARLCPEGIEATLFALLMSVMNIAALCSYQLGAGLTYFLGVTDVNFINLWLLVLITNLSNLLPLPLLGWLPETQTAIATSITTNMTSTKEPQPTLPEPSNSELLNPEPVAVAVPVMKSERLSP
jgi:folate/biopterin transporter